MNSTIRQLSPQENDSFKKIIALFADVFEREDHVLPSDEHLGKLLSNPAFGAFAAFQEDEIVGAVTVYTLDQYYSEKPLAYIYDVAVSTSHQRKGIGKLLIEHIRSRFQLQGFEEMFVQAEEIDDHALDFYRQTNPTEEQNVRHFNYRL